MRKVLSIKELIDVSYNRYKTQKAVTIECGYEKNINYFNYKFDIYSLARALKSKESRIKNKKVAIISENRYEFLVTYLANIILRNTVVVIDSNLNKSAVEKIIKKQNINTIFFSNKNKEMIIDIYKLDNDCKNKRRFINLVNFDSNNKFPIMNYEKLINVGRYIENYSIDNMIEKTEENNKTTIIANKGGCKKYSEEDFIKSAYIIGKSMRISRRKGIQSIYEINSFYKVVVNIILPIMYGLNIRCPNTEINRKTKNIEIQEYSEKKVIMAYKNNRYQIENINEMTKVVKLEKKNNFLTKNKQLGTQNFILIKSSNKYENSAFAKIDKSAKIL